MIFWKSFFLLYYKVVRINVLLVCQAYHQIGDDWAIL